MARIVEFADDNVGEIDHALDWIHEPFDPAIIPSPDNCVYEVDHESCAKMLARVGREFSIDGSGVTLSQEQMNEFLSIVPDECDRYLFDGSVPPPDLKHDKE